MFNVFNDADNSVLYTWLLKGHFVQWSDAPTSSNFSFFQWISRQHFWAHVGAIVKCCFLSEIPSLWRGCFHLTSKIFARQLYSYGESFFSLNTSQDEAEVNLVQLHCRHEVNARTHLFVCLVKDHSVEQNIHKGTTSMSGHAVQERFYETLHPHGLK